LKESADEKIEQNEEYKSLEMFPTRGALCWAINIQKSFCINKQKIRCKDKPPIMKSYFKKKKEYFQFLSVGRPMPKEGGAEQMAENPFSFSFLFLLLFLF
jgi:hypothetical protein